MVSEAEFDKNQATFRQSQQQGTDELGNQLGNQLGNPLPAGTRVANLPKMNTINANPFDPNQRINIGTPFGEVPFLGTAGGPAGTLGAGASVSRNVAGLQDDAARAVHAALLKAGVSRASAGSGAGQAAAIVREYFKRYGDDSIEAAKKAIDRAVFLGGIRGGLDPKSASKIAASAAKSFNPGGIKPASPATVSAALKSMGDLVGRIPGGKYTVGFISGGIVLRIFRDVLDGFLDDREAKAQTAIEFYANGYLTRDEMEKQIRGQAFPPEVEEAYLKTADDTKLQTDFLVEIASEVDITPIIGEERTELAARVQPAFISQQEKELEASQPVNELGLTQSEVDLVNKRFAAGAQGYVTTPSGQVVSPAKRSSQRAGVSASFIPGEQLPEKALNAEATKETDRVPAQAAAAVRPSTATNAGGGLFTPRFRTREELQNALGASITEAAWQSYLRTGRIPR